MKTKPAPKENKVSIPKKDLILSTSEEWTKKNEETELLELPSGIVVMIRKRAGLVSFAISGHVPLALLGEIVTTGGNVAKGSKAWDKVDEKSLTKMRGLMERIALLAVIEPKLSEGKEEGKVDVKEIDMDDLLVIFGEITGRGGSMQLLRPFL